MSTAVAKIKGWQRDDIEDRAAIYRQWRMELGLGAVTDVDQVEWRNGQPVAVLELTRVDNPNGKAMPPQYFDAILKRFDDDAQGRLACQVAERFGVHAWIVAFHKSLQVFWVYNLSERRGWWKLDQSRYVAWLKSMPRAGD